MIDADGSIPPVQRFLARLLLPHMENPRQNFRQSLANYIESLAGRVDYVTDQEEQ